MKFFLLALSMLILGPGAAQAQPRELHIFLLIGQSNMAGRANIPAQWRREQPGVWLWNTKKWEKARPGYNRYSAERKKNFTQGLNPGPSFAMAYRAANPGIEVGIVCMARGGSSIEQWAKNPQPVGLYNTAVAHVNTLIQDEGMQLKGVLWHQGESNSGRADAYPAKLKQLVENIRADTGLATLPVVFGQIGQWKPEYEAFNEMIVKQPAAIPHTACVTTEKLRNMDAAHFNAAAQEELGKRYAKAMLELLKNAR